MKRSSTTELSTTIILLISTFLLTPPKPLSVAATTTDTITTSQNITDDGKTTLTSSDGTYELGFFSPRNSNNRYVGIWYKKAADFTVAWVANRDDPITNSSGSVLTLINSDSSGSVFLALVDRNDTIIWSTNRTARTAKNPVAKLLDSGNLVIKEADEDDSSPDNYLWQSFDYPTDTLLPGMKLGKNLVTGREYYLTSWRSVDDPGTGDYTYHLDPTGYPQTILRRDSIELYRIGPWNGVGYSGLPALQSISAYSFEVVMNQREVYYHYMVRNNSVVSRFIMNYTGVGQRWMWVERSREWILYLTAPVDNCDSYKQCGAHGICNLGSTPICGCLDHRFVPKNADEWAGNDWSGGCVRRTGLNCSGDGFLKYTDMKLPDVAMGSWHNASMSLEECRVRCSMDCSCTAYTNLDVKNGGSGCLLWFGDLVDMKRVYGSTQDIYIRLAHSELDEKGNGVKLILSLTLSLGLILLGLGLMFCVFKRKKILLILRQKGGRRNEPRHKDLELPLFELSKISKATDNFLFQNKLGEGGYGPVFKGTLEDGQEIAVKRLSKSSLQGLDEFKNEVLFIVKLQHRNLVKLLGCCIHGEENMLVYEYMPNKSLDLILFDPHKSKQLDWAKRFQIIKGIARGLMYLHQDSRLRIIHRDLKTSNILLDSDMNPKISDFGLARSFRGNEIEAKTSRVVGTYGYMPPEYAIDGMFSIKSDVFSFGVIVLEILSGQKNRGFTHRNHHHNLLGHAWMLYKEGNSMEMLDQSITYETSDLSQVMKTIHVGLLCVQKSTDERPNMSSVVFMLENEVVLPEIKQPGFFMERDFSANDTSTSTQTKTPTSNEITMSLLEPR